MRYFKFTHDAHELNSSILFSLKKQGQPNGLNDFDEPYHLQLDNTVYTIIPMDNPLSKRHSFTQFGLYVDAHYLDGSLIDQKDINNDVLAALTLLTGRCTWVVNGELWKLRSRRDEFFSTMGEVNTMLSFISVVLLIAYLKTRK
jgi:hypothetical protein